MRRMGTLEKEISNNITSPCYKFSFTKELVATNQDNCAFGKEKCPDFLGFIDSGSVLLFYCYCNKLYKHTVLEFRSLK